MNPSGKPRALVVLLENVGHIHSLNLPSWARALIDFVSEAYAKFILLVYGAHRAYGRVVILEDEKANGTLLSETLLNLSRTHQVDVFLLVHGLNGGLVGYRGQLVAEETFAPLRAAYKADPAALDVRVVYGINCYGSSLVPTWQALGVQTVAGAKGVNWFPEPGLSSFLIPWLRGRSFKEAVSRSNKNVRRVGGRLLGVEHSAVRSSELRVYGEDITLQEGKPNETRPLLTR